MSVETVSSVERSRPLTSSSDRYFVNAPVDALLEYQVRENRQFSAEDAKATAAIRQTSDAALFHRNPGLTRR